MDRKILTIKYKQVILYKLKCLLIFQILYQVSIQKMSHAHEYELYHHEFQERIYDDMVYKYEARINVSLLQYINSLRVVRLRQCLNLDE